MGQRLDFHERLVELLGSRAVYFQPPSNIKMRYPCLVYERDYAKDQYADNIAYSHKLRYAVTFIGADPDSDIPEKLAQLPYSKFARHFASDDLNHDVYNVYF